MQAVEKEAKTRNCRQIVLETHDFQAPGFYQKLGFMWSVASMTTLKGTNI